MKKIAVGIVAVLGLTLLQVAPSKAAGETIVIIDNFFDSGRPELKDNIVYELCMTSGNFCSGRLMQQYGPGSANAPSNIVYKDGQTLHGTNVALAAKRVNPNIKMILIRTSGISNKGIETKINDAYLYKQHFEWILENKNKYNIVAVLLAKAPKDKDDSVCRSKNTHHIAFVNLLKRVSLSDIAIITGSGNSAWDGKTSFPACLQETVSVGGTMDWQTGIWSDSNVSSDVDFFAVAGWNLPTYRVVGTSFSSAAFAGYWTKNYQGSFQKTYDYLKSIGKNDSHSRIASYTFVDVTK